MNNRNFTHNSNFLFGTTIFGEDTTYSIQKCNLPGLSFNHISASAGSANLFIQGDRLTYNDLNLDIIIDENLFTWVELAKIMQDMRDNETDESKSSTDISWLEIHDDNTNALIKLTFNNSILESISDLEYNTIQDDEIITLSLTIKYDYFTIEVSEEYDRLNKIYNAQRSCKSFNNNS